MAAEYDLVVIGNRPAGVRAAIAARQWGARVALVWPPSATQAWESSGLELRDIWERTVSTRGSLRDDVFAATQIRGGENHPVKRARIWGAEVVRHLMAAQSPSVLESLGIDLVCETGRFVKFPKLAFAIERRSLRSRAYLLATGVQPHIPQIAGLVTTSYLDSETIGELAKRENLPSQMAIVGASPASVHLAQIWQQFGSNVTLLVGSSHILPKEDPEIAYLLQASLEASGVRVMTQATVTQVQEIQQKKWVLAGNRAIESDEIVFATGYQPDLEGWNLETVGVKWHLTRTGKKRLQVNAKLQTTNPQIYACGSLLGGYPFPHIGCYEAEIAVKNALFAPWFSPNYQGIPWGIGTQPEMARVGLTEAQAQRRYGDRIVVLRHSLTDLRAMQVDGMPVGLAKLVLQKSNGKLLGAHLLLPHARELIVPLAALIRQKKSIEAIATIVPMMPSYSELFQRLYDSWQEQKRQRHPLRQRLRETFFTWRRG
ncbi:NAD(P)/FAD-dependent oxidoreductase [Geitlerinema sp. PCC 9228]|jgi:pyruvate/2-oxoglutarate dehydrogenase complex dihydrolipoamide dehydrogenase (E3) component|uniref:dihydrolipoyl dehydrogenase family protein n=1 Tax=Geitlerinema sp. PCC 9228 TaxID=111611 RepID=UPI0008F9CEE6|nr:NAD(P)/FAD-dependent oxidoreductase [Geitlerinema sp. PCC 9228]